MDFDTKPEGESRLATFHTGICLRCRRSFEKVKDDPLLASVSAFSSRSNMDFVYGMEDANALRNKNQKSPMDPLFGHDENLLRKEFL